MFGALALALLAILPIIAQGLLKTNQIAIGGTSILILVSVALDTLRQLESRALMITYDDYTINIDSDSNQKRNNRLSFRRNKSETPA